MERFTALYHHINVERLRNALCGIKPEAAPGVGSQSQCSIWN
jgi:hypothetical protein